MFGDDLWNHIISYIQSFQDLLQLRCCKYLNRLFHEWFWAEIPTSVAPSCGMLFLVCDRCEKFDNIRCLSMPWVLFQAPVYKYCHRAECARTVLRQTLADANNKGYYFCTTRFVRPFVRISRRNYTTDALCSNRCIKMIGGRIFVLVFYGDPLVNIQKRYLPLSQVEQYLTNPIRIVKF